MTKLDPAYAQDDKELEAIDRKWAEWRARMDKAVAVVGCPACFSMPGEECRYSNGFKSQGVHDARVAKLVSL